MAFRRFGRPHRTLLFYFFSLQLILALELGTLAYAQEMVEVGDQQAAPAQTPLVNDLIQEEEQHIE